MGQLALLGQRKQSLSIPAASDVYHGVFASLDALATTVGATSEGDGAHVGNALYAIEQGAWRPVPPPASDPDYQTSSPYVLDAGHYPPLPPFATPLPCHALPAPVIIDDPGTY
jgi:hypothetical protein